MAYALLEGGRLWHDPRYQKLGTAMVSLIEKQEVVLVPSLGATLLPGPEGFHSDGATWILNPSYLQPSVLSYLAETFPQGPWRAVLTSLPQILAQGSGGGFAMDWVSTDGGVRPAATPGQGEDKTSDHGGQPSGSYDAIRVYLWLGMADPQTPGVEESLSWVAGMAGVSEGPFGSSDGGWMRAGRSWR